MIASVAGAAPSKHLRNHIAWWPFACLVWNRPINLRRCRCNRLQATPFPNCCTEFILPWSASWLMSRHRVSACSGRSCWWAMIGARSSASATRMRTQTAFVVWCCWMSVCCTRLVCAKASHWCFISGGLPLLFCCHEFTPSWASWRSGCSSFWCPMRGARHASAVLFIAT